MWNKIKLAWWSMIMWVGWNFGHYCPECGHEMMRFSTQRWDCLNCGHKVYTGW